MRDDLELIIKRYPTDFEVLRLYAIGDVHVGSPEFDEKSIKKKIQIIKDDPFGVVSLCGDLGDFGLKNSKSNVYFETMNPREQLDYIYELFLPIADKITACVPGNHEERLVRETGICPLLTLCSKWNCPEVYRENLAITKYIFGKIEGQNKQNSFVVVTTHGSTRNKHQKFVTGFDGIDAAISGHCHLPSYTPRAKIRVDIKNETASHVPYKEIVVDAHLKPGGYGLKKEYEIPAVPELQYLEFSSYRESDRNRRKHKVINYHAIQI